MSDLLDDVKTLKELAQLQRKSGNVNQAAEMFKKAIDVLEKLISTLDSKAQRSAIGELSDLYGILGGTLREQGDLISAARSYDAGFRYESDPQYGIRSSYNAMNRLITRIMAFPRVLTDPDSLHLPVSLQFVNVAKELVDLQVKLKNEIAGDRSNDYWAAGDLAIICALINDGGCAAEAVERFAAGSPPLYAYDAYLKSVETLETLDTPCKESLDRLRVLFSKSRGLHQT